MLERKKDEEGWSVKIRKGVVKAGFERAML
jgi:hypothetical protein